MSKLLGLNSSNALEVLKSNNHRLLTQSAVSVETSIQILQQTLANGEDSTVIDCRNIKSIRIWGNNSTLALLPLQYASTSDYEGTGNYDWQITDSLLPINIYNSYCINKLIDTPPAFIRIANLTPDSQQFSLRILKIT
mgnify:CR=1 FL=1